MPDIDLGQFEDRKVSRTTIAIRNTGHGLEEAMATDPQLMHHGDAVYVVLECEVEKVRHDRDGDGDELVRVHMLKAGTATIVEPSIVTEHIRAQHDRNLLRKEQESGVQRLGGFDPVTGEVRDPVTGEWSMPEPGDGGLEAGGAQDAVL